MESTDQLAEVRTLLNRAQTAADTETALDLAVGAYLQAAGYITLLEGMQKDAKALVAEIFLETGRTEAVTSAGKAAISSPFVSVTYDAKALDSLLRDDDDLAARLAPYRKETMRAGTLRITGQR